MAKVRWTVDQACEAWKCSRSNVYKWIKQNRITFEKLGRDYIILDDRRPERGETLTEEQRAAWPKGTPTKATRVVKRRQKAG